MDLLNNRKIVTLIWMSAVLFWVLRQSNLVQGTREIVQEVLGCAGASSGFGGEHCKTANPKIIRMKS